MEPKMGNVECSMLKYAIGSSESSKQLQPVLDSMFPPRLHVREDGSQVTMKVSSLPATRQDIANLKLKLHSALSERHQAKLVGLCPIRRVIYDQCFDELIRQVTIGCLEQGLLLFRVRNEFKMTLEAYKRIYESGVAFGLRKAIQSEECISEARERIELLERERSLLNQHVEESIRDEKTSEKNHKNILDNIRREYEDAMKAKDTIIDQQRNMIKALTQKSLEM